LKKSFRHLLHKRNLPMISEQSITIASKQMKDISIQRKHLIIPIFGTMDLTIMLEIQD
jgi:hypothetical protein